MTPDNCSGNVGGMGSNTTELRTGQIVQYTDPNGRVHDAMVNVVMDDKVRIKLQHGFNTTYLWVKPESLSIPR